MKRPSAKEETKMFLQSEKDRLRQREAEILSQLEEIQFQVKYVDSILEMFLSKPIWTTPEPVPAEPRLAKKAPKKKAPKKKAPPRKSPVLPQVSVTDEELVDAYFSVAGADSEITVRQWVEAINLTRPNSSVKKATPQAVRNKLANWSTRPGRPYRVKKRRVNRDVFYTMEKIAE